MMYPGYWIADSSKTPKPILDEMPKSNIPWAAPGGASKATVGKKYDTANMTAEVAELAPGATFFWFFSADEMHYVCQGEADIVYSFASTSHTERKNVHVTAGDFYIVPLGARLTWTVPATSKPFKLFSICQPGMPDGNPSRMAQMAAAKK